MFGSFVAGCFAAGVFTGVFGGFMGAGAGGGEFAAFSTCASTTCTLATRLLTYARLNCPQF